MTKPANLDYMRSDKSHHIQITLPNSFKDKNVIDVQQIKTDIIQQKKHFKNT